MKRILVVDDDLTMRELIHLHLRNAGYAVAVAEDALVAAKEVLRRPPDLMLVDVEMPYWDGLDFTATVRADSTVPRFPIVVMSAEQHHGERARTLGLKCLIKPFIKDQLLERISLELTNVEAEAEARPFYELSALAA